MMIYRYQLRIDDSVQLHPMPAGARIRHVDMKRGESTISMWAEVNPEARSLKRSFRVFGTGQNIDSRFVYVGTVLEGGYVWHVYEDTHAL